MRVRSLTIEAILIVLICLTGMSCSSSKGVRSTVAAPFVEGDIRIVPPVRVKKTKDGFVETVIYNDGGTKMITITDADGRALNVYIDHRLNKKGGTIYLNGYPGTKGSVHLMKQMEFKERILNSLQR